MQPSRQPSALSQRPRSYSARAEQVRRAAAAERFIEVQEALLRLAATYEALAARGIEFPPSDNDSRIIFPRCGTQIDRPLR